MDKNQHKGELHKGKGKLKEATGRALGNDRMERESKLEHAKGTVRNGYGDTRNSANKTAK